MARIHRVKNARPRFATEKLDEATPVMRKDGTQKTARRTGKPIVRRKTVVLHDQPKPNYTCGRCGDEIKPKTPDYPGDPYKWIQPKSGPYGGSKRIRCAKCPDWQVWEYSSSLSAQLAQVSYEFWQAVAQAGSEDDVQSALDDAAGAVREIAEAKQEGSDNIVSGFGHETSTSDELRDVAEQLEGWANDIEGTSIPEYPEPEEATCETCDGDGEVTVYATDDNANDEIEPCEDCDGTGSVTPDEPTDEQIQAWHDELDSELAIVDESPV